MSYSSGSTAGALPASNIALQNIFNYFSQDAAVDPGSSDDRVLRECLLRTPQGIGRPGRTSAGHSHARALPSPMP
jgi:hypothetical protein